MAAEIAMAIGVVMSPVANEERSAILPTIQGEAASPSK
jgi:hypothetical protein